jgi:putative addiction module CopG family antidote
MTIHLPEELERFVQSEVRSGRFASPDEAITEALRLLRQKKQDAICQRKPLTPDELNRQLLEAGLLSEIPPPSRSRDLPGIFAHRHPGRAPLRNHHPRAPLRWPSISSTAAPSSNATSKRPTAMALGVCNSL